MKFFLRSVAGVFAVTLSVTLLLIVSGDRAPTQFMDGPTSCATTDVNQIGTPTSRPSDWRDAQDPLGK